MKDILNLTKSGIVVFVLLSGLAGFAVGFPIGMELEFWQPVMVLVGLCLMSAGSFAINQAQEWRLDGRMPRTQMRPVARGAMSPWQAYAIGFVFILFGVGALSLLGSLPAKLGLFTVLLYNGLYTLHWKRKWAFGAVPGAIPGAMPVVIGYAAARGTVLTPDCAYLFLLMFLWQMPHFWALAIRFQKDYEAGGIPVLPAQLGVGRTLYHMGLYLFVYCGVALAAPWFLEARFLYLILVIPMVLKVLIEFGKYFRSNAQQNWLPFFLWVNLSILVFLGVPAVDKWISFVYEMRF